MAKIYFEAEEINPTQKRNEISEKFLNGETIRDKIKAVMKTDSTFVCALNTLAMKELTLQQTAIRKRDEKISEIPVKGSKPKKEKITARNSKIIK